MAVRYVVDHDEVVCFGDGDLSELSEGDAVVGTVHGIAGGQPLVATKFAVRGLPSESVPFFVVGEILGLNPRDRGRTCGPDVASLACAVPAPSMLLELSAGDAQASSSASPLRPCFQ